MGALAGFPELMFNMRGSNKGITMDREYVVAHAGDLKEGQMKELEVDGRHVLLVRVDGQFYAYGATCPHEGAPLAEGTLNDGHIRCPWHQSLYSAITGDMISPPSLDSLPKFPVRLDGQDVRVTIGEEMPESRPPVPAVTGDGDDRTFVILGGGAAGVVAAQSLRQIGFKGRVVMLSREDATTYDRTTLSKNRLWKEDFSYPTLRPDEFFQSLGIEFLKGREVTEVDVRSRTVSCSDHTWMQYDKLLLATGSRPRKLEVAGEDLKNIFLLRSMQDNQAIRGAISAGARRAVVVGAASSAWKWPPPWRCAACR